MGAPETMTLNKILLVTLSFVVLGLSLYIIMSFSGDNNGIVDISTESDEVDQITDSEANFFIDSSGKTHYKISAKDVVEPKEGNK